MKDARATVNKARPSQSSLEIRCQAQCCRQDPCISLHFCPECSFRERKMHLVSPLRIKASFQCLATSRLQRAKSCDESQYHRPLPRPWWWRQVSNDVVARSFTKGCDDKDIKPGCCYLHNDERGRDNDDLMRSHDDWESMMMFLVAAWLLRAERHASYAFSPK